MRKQLDLISPLFITISLNIARKLAFLAENLSVRLPKGSQKSTSRVHFKHLFTYNLFLIMSVFSIQINAATKPVQEVFVYRNVAYYDVEEAKQAIIDYVGSVQGVIPELLPKDSLGTKELLFQPYLDADEATPHVIVHPGAVNSIEDSVQYLMDENTVFGSPNCADSRLEFDPGESAFFNAWILKSPSSGTKLIGSRLSLTPLRGATLYSYSYEGPEGNKTCVEYSHRIQFLFQQYEDYQCLQTDQTSAFIMPETGEGIPKCIAGPVQKIIINTCYSPYTWNTVKNKCTTQCEIDSPLLALLGKCKDPEKDCSSRVHDPILAATGESYQPQSSDFIGGGAFPIKFTRNYKSYRIPENSFRENRWAALPLAEQATWVSYEQPFGYTGPAKITDWNWVEDFSETIAPIGERQWQHSYQLSLYEANSSTVFMIRANGDKIELNLQADGIMYLPSNPNGEQLLKILDVNNVHTGWQYTSRSGILESYSVLGKLLSFSNAQGLTQTLAYDVNNKLISVTDASGRILQLSYDSNGRLNTLIQPDGELIQFNYDAIGNLQSVVYPDDTPADQTNNPTVVYQYLDSRHPYALTGQVDENGDQYATWSFDAAGRATGSANNGGYKQGTVTYSANKATVVEANGQTRDLTFDQGTRRVIQVAGGNCGQCGTSDVTNYTHNTLGQIISQLDFNGVETTFEYNAQGLQTKRTEAKGTPEEQVTVTVWHAALNLPLEITTARSKTTFAYGVSGRLETVVQNDLTAQASSSRQTTYQYQADGLITTITTPNGGITTYSYDLQKNLASITNALGYVTQISAIDANGRPISMVDANGSTTVLAYDPRGRLVSQTVSGNTTSFIYDNIGQLVQLILANGNVTNYQYNGARLLTQVSDALGNKMIYSHDNVGNITKTEVKDPNNVLRRTQSQVYDQLNRLTQQVGANNQVTKFAYDSVGNRISAKSPLLKETLFSFDGLNRLKQSTDPLGGTTQYQYDSQNHLISIIDPRNNTTAYVYDGFGNLMNQTSPDTGTMSFTYDVSGNQISKTDAKNATINYSYDLLNRLTAIDYPGSEFDVTLAYDVGSNAKGRLSTVNDSSGNTQYVYNSLGQLVSKTSTVSGKVFVLAYAYDAAGLLAEITYPSGRLLALTRSSNGQISQVSSTFASQTKVLLSSANYVPFGPAESYSLGNGKSVTRQFDLDGRINAIDVSGIYQSLLGYNANNSIVQLQAPLQSTMQQDFTYDDLDRLTEAAGAYGDSLYQYDSVGNRTQKSLDSAVSTLDYDPLSNRLTTGYQHDANGNRISDNEFDFQYGEHNRLKEVTVAGVTNSSETRSYLYNGLGQRVKKTSIFRDVIYLYDESGLLIAEADSNGVITKEYVYFEGQPLTMMVGE